MLQAEPENQLVASLFNLHKWSVHDPKFINLRKAARASLIAPPFFLFCHLVLDQSLIGVFGFLSAFTLIVFADLGGPIRRRFASYLVLIVLTDLAIIAGTTLSDTTIAASLVMFGIMFGVSFLAVFGGIAAALIAPTALAYSFTVFLPLETVGLEARLVGWTLGGLCAAAGAVILWPINMRDVLRKSLANVAEHMAEGLSRWQKGDSTDTEMAAVGKKLADARQKAANPMRPANVGERDVGLHHLLDNLNYAEDLLKRLFRAPLQANDASFTRGIAATLKEAAISLRGEQARNDMAKSISALDHARDERRQKLRQDASDLVKQDDPDFVSTIRQTFGLLTLSHVVLWLVANAATAVGQGTRVHPVSSAPELSSQLGAEKTAVRRARFIAIAHLDPDGVIFHDSMRAAIAMMVAILIAKVLPFEHKFWVTLGVLSILRSSALSTSMTALQAIAGTFVGFVISVIMLLTLHTDPSAMVWLIAPLVFLAAYTPGVLGFAVGQASFTAMVVILFNMLQPLGFSTAVIRLEAVTLGAVTTAFIGLLLWPRGARAAIARAAADVYSAAADGLRARLADDSEQNRQADQKLIAAQQRATSAFSVALSEHGERINTEAWSTLSRPPSMVRALIEGLLQHAPNKVPAGCDTARTAVGELSENMVQRLDGVAADLASLQKEGAIKPDQDPSNLLERQRQCIKSAAPQDGDAIGDALVILAWCDWLLELQKALDQIDGPLAEIVHASAPRAWLRWSQIQS